MNKICVIAFNSGLGDHIVMSAGVRLLAKQYKYLHLICRNSDYNQKFLYKDAPNIKTITHRASVKDFKIILNKYRSKYNQSIDVDFKCFFCNTSDNWPELMKKFNLDIRTKNWCDLFYTIFKLPLEERYNFYFERNFEREKSLEEKIKLPEKYIFAVDRWSAKKINIDYHDKSIPIINPDNYSFETSIFDWMGVIEKSECIYTVDTSWFHLIYYMQLKDKIKFFYRVRNVPCANYFANDSFNKNWFIV
jgi:hypothetical protein